MDTQHYTCATYKWILEKNGTVVDTFIQPSDADGVTTEALGDGSYTIKLEVSNGSKATGSSQPVSNETSFRIGKDPCTYYTRGAANDQYITSCNDVNGQQDHMWYHNVTTGLMSYTNFKTNDSSRFAYEPGKQLIAQHFLDGTRDQYHECQYAYWNEPPVWQLQAVLPEGTTRVRYPTQTECFNALLPIAAAAPYELEMPKSCSDFWTHEDENGNIVTCTQ